MEKQQFQQILEKNSALKERIRQSAHELHDSVNQIYGDAHPYGFHLDMVVGHVCNYGHIVCNDENDVMPLIFGSYYHDSIEDARLTYNDVMNIARTMLTEEQAIKATEIVYALTNDKGRTRSERAGEQYYKGIRQTPYAPFVKLCDRLANISYSCNGEDGATNRRMKAIYKQELPHFLEAIDPHSSDPRLAVPDVVVEKIAECLIDELEREEQNQCPFDPSNQPSTNF